MKHLYEIYDGYEDLRKGEKKLFGRTRTSNRDAYAAAMRRFRDTYEEDVLDTCAQAAESADPGRPMLKDVRGPEDIARLMARREDAYRAAGGAEVVTDGRGAEEIAREILKIASDGAEDPDTAGEDG